MKKLFKNKKGFTLVELIVVIVIIVILAAALVTSLIGYINKAKDTNGLVEANNVYTAAQAYISENFTGTAVTQYADTDALDDLDKAVNEYLGMADLVAAADISVCTTDAKGTITDFKYLTSNGKTATFSIKATDKWSIQ